MSEAPQTVRRTAGCRWHRQHVLGKRHFVDVPMAVEPDHIIGQIVPQAKIRAAVFIWFSFRRLSVRAIKCRT